jgi:cell wall-associated NlpC family hydrolase
VGLSASLLAASYGVVVPTSASADQLSSLKAQAEGVASQIQTLGNQEDALSEQYDEANNTLQTDKQKVAQAAGQVASADASANKAKQTLRTEALNAYIHNGTAGASGTASLGSADQSLLRAEYVSSLTNDESDAQDQYHLAALQASTAKNALEAAQNAAQQQVATLDSDRQQVSATQSQLQAVYNKDQGQIATLVAQIQAQQEAAEQAAATAAANARVAAQAAAARAAAAAAIPTALAAHTVATPASTGSSTTAPSPSSSTSSGPSAPVVDNPPPPPGAGAAGAVAAAETRLGDEYVWGAAGPTTFDCSGLVQWAFAQVGISLPHYSGAQFADGVQIPMSDLEPGDLVFFSDPGEHVAIYIGGGQVIEAPHTGAVVHIVPMYSEFTQAVRIS